MCRASPLLLAGLVALWPLVASAEERFEEIVSSLGQRSREEVRARMGQWIAAHPADPDAARGLVWIAKLHLFDGDPEAALPYLERVGREFPRSESARAAAKSLGDIHLGARRFGRAVAHYDALAQEPSPFWSYVGKEGAREARSARVRYALFVILAAGLALLMLWRLWRARSKERWLWPPPEEVTFVAPVTAVISLAALNQAGEERVAALLVAGLGLLLLWVNAAYLRARPPSSLARAREAVLAVVQAAALLYCAVIATGLWDKFFETLAVGAER